MYKHTSIRPANEAYVVGDEVVVLPEHTHARLFEILGSVDLKALDLYAHMCENMNVVASRPKTTGW